MANIPTYDPGSSEARSPLIAGLTEAANKISSILSMKSKEYSNEPLDEVYISTNDRYRIYQVDMGKRLWLASPTPIIRKNGNIIKPETDYFSIDYVGGSIAFDENYRLTSSDNITADFTCVTAESTVLSEILNDIVELQTTASHDKGFYETEDALKLANPTGVNGDHAIVGETDTTWVWDSDSNSWVDTHKPTDLSNYYNKTQVDGLLSAKEPTIQPKQDGTPGDFYYSGEKQWVDLIYKIRNANLTGLDTSSATVITEVDTIISALGKLQAQLNPLSGINDRIESVENKNSEQDNKISALEVSSHTHNNKSVLDSITEEKVQGWDTIDTVSSNLTSHTGDSTIHVTEAEKEKWNNGVTRTPIPVTLTASGWSGSAPYTQTVSVSGITANDVPEAWLTGTVGTQAIGYSMISSISSGAGTVTFTAVFSKPAVDLPINVRW